MAASGELFSAEYKMPKSLLERVHTIGNGYSPGPNNCPSLTATIAHNSNETRRPILGLSGLCRTSTLA